MRSTCVQNTQSNKILLNILTVVGDIFLILSIKIPERVKLAAYCKLHVDGINIWKIYTVENILASGRKMTFFIFYFTVAICFFECTSAYNLDYDITDDYFIDGEFHNLINYCTVMSQKFGFDSYLIAGFNLIN